MREYVSKLRFPYKNRMVKPGDLITLDDRTAAVFKKAKRVVDRPLIQTKTLPPEPETVVDEKIVDVVNPQDQDAFTLDLTAGNELPAVKGEVIAQEIIPRADKASEDTIKRRGRPRKNRDDQ